MKASRYRQQSLLLEMHHQLLGPSREALQGLLIPRPLCCRCQGQNEDSHIQRLLSLQPLGRPTNLGERLQSPIH